MATLEELARKKFSFLSEAEIRVVQAAPDGTFADCSLGGDVEPEKADTWPETRNVRADLIRWLCVDREAREQIDPRGIQILGARITEPLDLSFTNVLFPLGCFGCRLEQPLNLRWAKMAVLNLEGSWTKGIFADGLKLEGSLFLRNGFHAEGGVRLLGATVGGDLDAEGGTFKNPDGMALDANSAKISGRVFLREGFSSEGEVRLLGATIGDELNAKGGTFKSAKGYALNADRIKVTGSVFLSGGFHAEGEVRLLGATIGSSLEARGGAFKNSKRVALNADRIEVHGSVFLGGKFVAEGTVRLVGAEIRGQLEVDDAWLDGLDLDSADITEKFFWRNIHEDHGVLHPDFPSKEWEPNLSLTAAKVGSLADEEASWPGKGRLILDGFVYERIGGNAPIDATARLKWLRLQPDRLGFRPQPYEQLIAVLRRMGHEDQVAKVAIAKQLDLRKRGHLGWWGWTKNWFLYLAVGYGYRAWLAFIWLLVLVVLGSCVFSRAHSANVLVPSDQEAYKPDETVKTPLPDYYPKFNAAVYSLDVIFPFDLGQKSHWRLSEKQSGALVYWIFEFYSLAQLFLGWVLLLVAAAVPAGYIKKD
jgi:hypothetical protein